MQLTWNVTSWLGIASAALILFVIFYDYSLSRGGPDKLSAWFVLVLAPAFTASLWLVASARQPPAPKWHLWLAAFILVLYGILFGVLVILAILDPKLKSRSLDMLGVLALALLATGLTGLFNLSTPPSQVGLLTKPWITELAAAQSDIEASRGLMADAMRRMQTVETEAEELENLISELEQQQTTLQQWLELKGNEEILRSYFDEQFRRNSREQVIWGLVGLIGGGVIGLVSPGIARRFRTIGLGESSPNTES